MMSVPELTEEQRERARKKAMAARHERSEFKALVKSGAIPPATALDDPRAQRMRVKEFLRSVNGVGKARAWQEMAALHIAGNRRVQGLGKRQKEGLLDWLNRI